MCFVNLLSLGKKVSDMPLPKQQKLKPLSALGNREFIPNHEFVDQINSVQSLQVTVYGIFVSILIEMCFVNLLSLGKKVSDMPLPCLLYTSPSPRDS